MTNSLLSSPRFVFTSESVTEWLQNLKQGDSIAAQKLWQRYIERLVRLARKHLRTMPRRMADE